MFGNNNKQPRLSVFQSADTARQFLQQCYKQLHREDAVQRSYTNCYPFLYYLEHGQNFYATAQQAPLSIKPVLLFYGMVQLLKACLLTVDPDYPESTSVLAHGVSARKRKKQGYEFLDDEVKVQKNGLFTHFSEKMFHVKQEAGEKFRMGALLQRIGELHDTFFLLSGRKKQLSLPVVHTVSPPMVAIPKTILDYYHMPLTRFLQYLREEGQGKAITFVNEEGEWLRFQLTAPLSPVGEGPFFFQLDGTYRIAVKKEKIFLLPEIHAHYLLLYNLSMISRYETEWWCELLHSYPSKAYIFIVEFLTVSAKKVPWLVNEYLMQKWNSCSADAQMPL
ncbi:YaaC family protein [Geobacillus sp. C56-T2]|uniref:YaaC family protein n=1 Tax=Geobacillus sp. C56-T2 TaxID=600773 RepID=UPI0011A13692|nr:YaaC family protein [Geobacillus sp. C56-T2]TWG29040.1 YaaC-like protein [Geobacillus sp. C56-T2]